MKIRDDFTCPLELVHDMLKGKWKPIILWRLRLGETSLSKLEKDITGITQKMLLEHLKELIDFGFVKKQIILEKPLTTTYSLTENYGQDIILALTIMQKIGISYMIKTGKENILKEKNLL